MATAAGGIATPKNIVDYISAGSTILGIMASATSTVANKCITYGILSSSTVNAGLFNIAGTYTNEKCVKFSDISKKVTLGLTFTPNSVSFTAGGGSATATFTSTNGSVSGVPFSATKPTWISVSGTVGLASLSASANTSTSSRSGTVYISSAVSGSTLGSSAVGTVYVTQAGGSATPTISKITVSPTTVNAVVGSVSGINSVSYVSGTVTYSNGTTKPVGNDTNCSTVGSNSTYALAWQAGSSGIAFNTLAVGNSTITIQGGGKTATVTLKSTSPTINTKLSSILKCCLVQSGVTTVSVGNIDIVLAKSASGANATTWHIYSSNTDMRTISEQSGVFTINNFNLYNETSYINSSSLFNSLYVRIYIGGITWTGSNSSKTVSLCKYSTSGAVTALINRTLSNGAPFDSGYISLTSFTAWNIYNTPTYTTNVNLVRCNTARVVPMTLYIR